MISRNILATGLLEMLAKNARVVVLAPQLKKEYFEREFAAPSEALAKDGKIIVEGVNTDLSRRDLFFRKLFWAFSASRGAYIKKRAKFYEDGDLADFILSAAPAFLFRGSRIAVGAIRFLDNSLPESKDLFSQLFLKYKPEKVFLTDLQNELDVRLLKSAKKAGIKTIGMIRSWDNLSSKGLLRALPDTLITHNETIKKEAVRTNFADEASIIPIGIPHYDKYVSGKTMEREEFFRKFNLDPKKKTVLFAPIGDRYIRNNETDKYVLETLSGLDVNILVRLPPMDVVNFKGFASKGAKVVLDKNGTSVWKGGEKLNEISKDDDAKLHAQLKYSDIVVTGQSTISIDAALFGKQSIIACFEPPPRRNYWDSVRRYYDYDYFLDYAKSGGIKFADSPQELVRLVEECIKNPDLNKPALENIIKTQIFRADGKATERLANVLLS